MKKEKIMLIGAAILDVLVHPAGPQVFQTGSYPAEEIRMSTGGDALNEAGVLAKLGESPLLCTLLGEDEPAQIIETYCKEKGISLQYSRKRAGIPTGMNVVLVDEEGNRSFLTNRNGTLRKLSREDIPLPFPEEVKILGFASIFVSPLLGVKEMAEIFRAAKEQDIIVCADMTKCKQGETAEDLREALAFVDYLMPNEEEALLVTQKTSPEEAVEEFLRQGVKNVIIKCGKRGCLVGNRRELFWVPAIVQKDCVDTTGAGDSFVGGFLYSLLQGKTLKDCARFANACGAAAVRKVGATEGIESREQIEEILNNADGQI
ncbi:carbohydrate kinase family protein [Blautia sp. An249]|uniref:carbohydrate kinase family protein n=1 Tax=Blautia sp. An249 TaxID=1965603 RepID=UPI001FA92E73|nr:carbohydrate kinase family protein [Blautia sp. An249]